MTTDLAPLVAAVGDDPEVRAAVKGLALAALAQAHDLVVRGTPAVKAKVVAGILPALVRSLGESQDTTTTDQLRAELDDLFAQMRG
jgi:hypothetical protein